MYFIIFGQAQVMTLTDLVSDPFSNRQNTFILCTNLWNKLPYKRTLAFVWLNLSQFLFILIWDYLEILGFSGFRDLWILSSGQTLHIFISLTLLFGGSTSAFKVAFFDLP